MTQSDFHEQVEQFETAYANLVIIAEKYPVELQTQSGACGSWSASDILAHLNGWIVEALRRYKRFPKGTGDITYNIDTFNKVSLWLREDMPYQDILSETKTLSAKLVAIAKELPEAYIQRDKRYQEWLDNLTREAIEHSQQLRDFLKQHTISQ